MQTSSNRSSQKRKIVVFQRSIYKMSGEAKNTDQDEQARETAPVTANNTSEAATARASDQSQEVNTDKESSCCGCCS
jgi:hypothetical protein